MTRSQPVKEAFIFSGLTLGLSFFVCWGPLALFQIPAASFVRGAAGPAWAVALYLLGGFTPSLAALLLTWMREGAAGLRRIGRRLVQFNIGGRWYLAAVTVVLLGTAGQLALHSLLGKAFDLRLFAAQLGSLLPLLVVGPLSEEIGWRGYALDRLQTRWSALTSALIVGLVWGLWHAVCHPRHFAA